MIEAVWCETLNKELMVLGSRKHMKRIQISFKHCTHGFEKCLHPLERKLLVLNIIQI